ncbi:mannonate dehydratase [Candidatus Poribacteria bacterium]
MDEYEPNNIKLTHSIGPNASDDDLLFLKQIGLRWVRLHYGDWDADVDKLSEIQKRFAQYGVQIYSAHHPAYRSLKIQLGQPERDKDIELCCAFIRVLGKLGIPVTVYDFHPGNTFTTSHVERRGYIAREFDLDEFRNNVEKNRFEREYSAEEMWEYYTYFVKAVLPVAEEANVRMGLHPDDPPLAKMNGVAKLFTNYSGYRRAEEIAGFSKYWGLLFCVGTWGESGDHMGKDVLEMIHDFGGKGKIFEVHFRNVSSPLPRFVETFHDDGYMDMYKVMKALCQVRYTGSLMPDHIPQLVNDTGRRAGLAYCIAYMRALLRRANEEVG